MKHPDPKKIKLLKLNKGKVLKEILYDAKSNIEGKKLKKSRNDVSSKMGEDLIN